MLPTRSQGVTKPKKLKDVCPLSLKKNKLNSIAIAHNAILDQIYEAKSIGESSTSSFLAEIEKLDILRWEHLELNEEIKEDLLVKTLNQHIK